MKYSVVLLKLRIKSCSPNSDYMLLGLVIELTFSES